MDNLTSQNDNFLNRIYQFIEDNLDNEYYSVKDLAGSVGLSRSMLHRKLIKLTGKSASDLIMQKRMEKARELLENDVATVSEIAYMVGFNSPSYFNKVFKKYFKVSPGSIKKQPKQYTRSVNEVILGRLFVRPKLEKYVWIGLVAACVILIYIIANAWKSVPFSEQDWIIITDFENLTGDTLFDQSLNRALEISLQQSSYVNVYPRSRINEVLERMKMDKINHVDENIGMEIAKRDGIKLILVCSISEIGGIYTLGSKIIEVKTGETLRSQNLQAKGKEKILNNLDKLGRKLRKDLGESLESINYETIPLPAATTHSLEALDYLVKAKKLWVDEGKKDEAVNLLQEALKLDQDFALAHAELGYIFYWTSDRETGERHFKRAMELLDRLTQKERLLIEANMERYRGNHDVAVIKFGAFLEKYPDSENAWFSLGYSYMMLFRFEEAIAAFNKSLGVFNDDNANALINIATCYSYMHQYSLALEYYLKAFSINPALLKINNINHEFGFNYVAMGEYEKAMEVFNKMTSGDEEKAFGLRSKALLYIYLGKFREGIHFLNESCLIYKTLGYELSRFRNLLFIAKAYQFLERKDELEKSLEEAYKILEKESFSPDWLLYYGKLSVRTNRNIKRDSILEKLESSINEGNRKDNSAFNLIKGEIELKNGNYTTAEEFLKTGVKLNKTGYSLESLAHYYLETDKYELAEEKYLEIIDITNLGWEAQPCLIEAIYQLGKINEAKSDILNAVKYYRELENLWKDTDDNIPMLLEVKSKLDTLSNNILNAKKS